MITNPVVYGGKGSAWKEVDRGYVAEHAGDRPSNVLVAIFTPDFPDQPMIVPASGVFGIGNPMDGTLVACGYGSGSDEEGVYKTIYGVSFGGAVGFANAPNGDGVFMDLHLDDSSGSGDLIPEGWTIKYFIYEA